jgi:sRNA-binding regulator protein Hfq
MTENPHTQKSRFGGEHIKPKKNMSAARSGSKQKHRSPKGKPSSTKTRKPAFSPEILQKAADISSRTGIDKKRAIGVALGRTTVQEVLKEMMVEEKAERYIRQHDLARGTAFAVARGIQTLENALLLKSLRQSESWQPDRSVLWDLKKSKSTGIFYIYGRKPLAARVTQITKYDCWLAPPDEADEKAEELQKHDILLVCPPEQHTELETHKSVDSAVAEKQLGPSVNYSTRARSSKRTLFRHHRDNILTRVVLRDGTVLEGKVDWFGKWEFRLLLSETCGVVVFRHAMYALEGRSTPTQSADRGDNPKMKSSLQSRVETNGRAQTKKKRSFAGQNVKAAKKKKKKKKKKR